MSRDSPAARTKYKALGVGIVQKYRAKGAEKSESSDDPTLREFFLFLKDEIKTPLRMNPHWKPMYLECDVCHYNYKFIGRVETIDQDSADLQFAILHFDRRIAVPLMRPPGEGKHNERHLLMKETVERDLAETVLSVYAIDYQLFGYDLENDLNMVYN